MAYLFARFVLGLEGQALFAVVVASALPTAQNVFVAASRYHRPHRGQDTVLITTVVAVPAMIGVALLLACTALRRNWRGASGTARQETGGSVGQTGAALSPAPAAAARLELVARSGLQLHACIGEQLHSLREQTAPPRRIQKRNRGGGLDRGQPGPGCCSFPRRPAPPGRRQRAARPREAAVESPACRLLPLPTSRARRRPETEPGPLRPEVDARRRPVRRRRPAPAARLTPASALDVLAPRSRSEGSGPRPDTSRELNSDSALGRRGPNGCDTRNDILRRDLTAAALKAGTTAAWCSAARSTTLQRRHHRVRPRRRHVSSTCRSTTSSRSATPGRRAPSSCQPAHAAPSPTTR